MSGVHSITEPAWSTVVASWAEGTFLENLAVQRDGTILVTSFSERAVHAVASDGETRTLANFSEPVTGIVATDEVTFVCSGVPGKGPWWVHRIDVGGKISAFVELPDALLLNGFTPFRARTALAVDF